MPQVGLGGSGGVLGEGRGMMKWRNSSLLAARPLLEGSRSRFPGTLCVAGLQQEEESSCLC